jgi:fibronectin type 3 domain-containing protein
MRNGSKVIHMLKASLVVVVLLAGTVLYASDEPDGADCWAGNKSSAAVHPPSPDITAGATAKPHKVKLSWDPSASAHTTGATAVTGYNIYRHELGNAHVEQINLTPIQGTRCVDYSVKAGQTYFYQAKTVGTNGRLSVPSNEAKATIKSP